MIRKPTDLSQVKLYSGLEGAFVKGVEIINSSIGEGYLIFGFPQPSLFPLMGTTYFLEVLQLRCCSTTNPEL
jgi:hypothetical protein